MGATAADPRIATLRSPPGGISVMVAGPDVHRPPLQIPSRMPCQKLPVDSSTAIPPRRNAPPWFSRGGPQLASSLSRPLPGLSVDGPLPQISCEMPQRFSRQADPSCLVLGSSMVRHLCLPRVETFCYPGARVSDIKEMLPSIVLNHPAATTIIFHVGSNDISLESSVDLEADFKNLINTLLETGRQCVISALIPSICFGDVNFSRIRQLHI